MPAPPGSPPYADDVAPRGTKAWRQAVNARRAWVGDQLWRQATRGGLDLSNPDALSEALARMGIVDEVGGGRHQRNLFMGNLPSEGFGMSTISGRENLPYAMEAYMPDWRRWHDRDLQRGLTRTEAEGNYPGPGFLASSQSFSAPTPETTTSTPAPGGLPGGLPDDIQTGSLWPEASFSGDESPWDMASQELRRRRPGMNSLGSLGAFKNAY